MCAALTVRPPKRNEFAAWARLWEGYNAFYDRAGATAIPDAVTRATWARFHDPAEPVHALVAEADGRLVGLAHHLFHLNTAMLAPVCYMQDLFTDADSRGKGVGRALVEAVYDQAREAGSPRVYWHTHETNAQAMRLYDSLAGHTGFVVYRRDLGLTGSLEAA